MNSINQAKEIIRKHSGQGSSVSLGLLDSFRPYQGFSDRDAQEFFEAIIYYSVESTFPQNDQLEIIYCLWNTCHTIRRLALSANGPLQRNAIIDNADIAHIEKWVDSIEHSCLIWISGDQDYKVALPFADYITNGHPIADKKSAFKCLFDFLKKAISQENSHSVESNSKGFFEKSFDAQYSFIIALEKLGNESKEWVEFLKKLSSNSESKEIRDEARRILNQISKESR
ncbi:hypothetical protein [Gimesia aquarii]|uniref:Uncharacterized protein n=1 Tax=Gimesia aquarii TaxID=2527964 RepID=A0A517WUY4_9PLAN|nr:hypothetical protein [Gimesia aquarii]QDU09056.1 hypothetical protein V202x_24270 [Gimesia aquarii]